MKLIRFSCPACGSFLVESSGAIRCVCRSCGAELTFTPKELRVAPGLTKPLEVSTVLA